MLVNKKNFLFELFSDLHFLGEKIFHDYLEYYNMPNNFKYILLINKILYALYKNKEEIFNDFQNIKNFTEKYNINILERDIEKQIIFIKLHNEYEAISKDALSEQFKNDFKMCLKKFYDISKFSEDVLFRFPSDYSKLSFKFYLGLFAAEKMKNSIMNFDGACKEICAEFKIIHKQHFYKVEKLKRSLKERQLNKYFEKTLEYLKGFNFGDYITEIAYDDLKHSFNNQEFYENNKEKVENFFSAVLTDMLKNKYVLNKKN